VINTAKETPGKIALWYIKKGYKSQRNVSS